MSSANPVIPIAGVADGDERLFDSFLAEVRGRHLAEWLPDSPATVLDVSRSCPGLLNLMLEHGHTVVHAEPRPRALDIHPTGPGRLLTVQADPLMPDWLADGGLDAVVAEACTLSGALAAEVSLDRFHQALRPGGRLLACVDSLVAGLASLADQGRWAELADVPAADVVLIPGGEGRVTRCFWPEELHGMLTGAGFTVEWIRPRTVLTQETVVRALRQDPAQLDSLVATELALEVRRQGESIGPQLVASARREG